MPAARGQCSDIKVAVQLDEEIGIISPLLYGHFTEHIGRLI